MNKKIHVYRVGNREIGHGHVTRCRALVEALLALGWIVEQHDSLDGLRPEKGDTVVIDSNEIARADVMILRRHAFVVNLAARGDAKWYADVSFLHTTYLDGACPPGADPAVWSGPEYQLVRKEFLQARRARKPPNSPPRKIFVSHGGSDPMGHTELTLEALEEIAGDWTANIVLGCDFERELILPPRAAVLRDVPVDLMAGLMVAADLGICSMGMTTYEACCTGLPTVNVCGDEFHREVAGRCQARGFLRWVRPQHGLLAAAVQDLGSDEFQLRLTSRNALAYVTGRGAETVARMITEFTKENDLFPAD